MTQQSTVVQRHCRDGEGRGCGSGGMGLWQRRGVGEEVGGTVLILCSPQNNSFAAKERDGGGSLGCWSRLCVDRRAQLGLVHADLIQ